VAARRTHQQNPTIRSSQFNTAAFLTYLVKVKLKALKVVSREFTLMALQFKVALALTILLATPLLPETAHRRKHTFQIQMALNLKKEST
jgi:hypothetical protein